MACRSRGGRLRPGVRAGWQSRRARRSEPDWHAPCHCGWHPIASVKALHFRLFPMISNHFQSIPITFYKIMKRLLGDFRYAIDDLRGFGGAGVKPVAVPQSAGCAGRQGRSATLSTRRGSKCWGWASAGNSGIFDELRSFPMISNHFQSIPITF